MQKLRPKSPDGANSPSFYSSPPITTFDHTQISLLPVPKFQPASGKPRPRAGVLKVIPQTGQCGRRANHPTYCLTDSKCSLVIFTDEPCSYEKARPSSRPHIPYPSPKHSISPTLLSHDTSKSSRNIPLNSSLNAPTQLNVRRLADPRPQILAVEFLLDGSIWGKENQLLKRGLRSRMILQRVGRS